MDPFSASRLYGMQPAATPTIQAPVPPQGTPRTSAEQAPEGQPVLVWVAILGLAIAFGWFSIAGQVRVGRS